MYMYKLLLHLCKDDDKYLFKLKKSLIHTFLKI